VVQVAAVKEHVQMSMCGMTHVHVCCLSLDLATPVTVSLCKKGV
jgi:hypothetical protein